MFLLPSKCQQNKHKQTQNSEYTQWVFTCSKLTKTRHQSDPIDIRTSRNIDIALMSLLLTLKRFHTFSQYFVVAFVERCWLGLPTELKYRQVKILKYARTGANYVILTKWIKLKHEKTPASYLKSMQNVGFEQIPTKFIEIFVA